MIPRSTGNADPWKLARETECTILRHIHDRIPALVVDSPPGAGKTTLGINIVSTAWGLLRENAMVACWTNRQAIDFAERLARKYSKVPVQLFVKQELAEIIPADVSRLRNLTIVHKTGDLDPHGVAVSNVSKWLAYPLPHRYRWLFVDEAYQLPDYRFQQLVPLADRYILVGDPGQIPPLIQADVSPWGCDPAGPHVPCPKALVARHRDVPLFRLPVSWRLPTDSAAIVRDAFYEFDFQSGDPEGRRRLELDRKNGQRADPVLDLLAQPGASIATAVLGNEKIATDVDPEIAAFAAEAAARLLKRGARTHDEDGKGATLLMPQDIGIVTAHRAQVAEIEKRLHLLDLATGEDGIVVETTERWQGLQRRMMIVHHPLSGLSEISPFDLDRGRLCVMLSRHQIAGLVIGRETISHALEMHSHTGERFPGTPDEEHLGWRAHTRVWEQLVPSHSLSGICS